MATIRIDLDNTLDARIVAAFAKAHAYRDKLEDGSDNPETRRQFMIRKVKEFIRQSAIQAEVAENAETARLDALAKAEAEILIP